MINNRQKKFEIIIKIIIFNIILKSINKKRMININNKINETIYQEDEDFSKYKINYKIVAIYYPPNYFNEEKKFDDKNITVSKIINKYEINYYKTLIKHQIQLAKNHGIFGFGIIYNCMKLNEEIFYLFAFDQEINLPFFIILNYYWKNVQHIKNSLMQNIAYKEKELNALFDNIINNFKSENYIKFRGKYILGIIYSSSISQFIRYIREYEIKNKKDSSFIISISLGKSKFDNFSITDSINSIIEFPLQNTNFENSLNKIYFYNYFYNDLYKMENIKSKSIKYFFIVNGCIPYKFYKIFKEYLYMTKTNKDYFLIFNAWNNYKENSFLEPNEEFGYSYLNYFSKAIFKENIDQTYDLHSLNSKCKIAIQVHLFYEDLIDDIINKINNIPVKFDLFITITSPKINNFIKNYIKMHSKANYFEILIVENKGRDILPFLNQIKTKFRSYKYLCHIHSKKSKYSKRNDLGVLWRNYLLKNLLGNTNIISEILYDFQNNRKLGFIFPETFYLMINQFYTLTNKTKYYMDFVASKLFPKYEIGKLINFPAGNMFWAKIDAIYQIFLCDLNKYFPKESGQINDTIMHGIERIWLYLVKFNGFYYKSVFKFF